MRRGLLFVISGPAGSGKGTVIAELRKKCGDFAYSVSATTRTPRPGEVNGKEYYFIDRAEFEKRLGEDEFLEHTEYCGNYYGTLRSEVDRILDDGKHVILEIEVEGAMQIAKKCPDAIKIMLLPPNFSTLTQRLVLRNTDQNINERLQRAKTEIGFFDKYDYFALNDTGNSEACADSILKILESELMKTSRNTDFPEEFLNN